MTKELREATRLNREYQRTSQKAENLRAKRNAAIKKAVAAGISQADLARALEITPGRITQILQE